MTQPESRLAAIVRAWAASAQADRDALILLEAEGPALIVGFHAQQAVEKLVKALLIAHGVEPDETHVIGRLVAQLHRLDRVTATALGPVDQLTPYAVLHRYPPRPERGGGRPLDRSRVLADLMVARNACATLDNAVAVRLRAIADATAADS